MKNRIARLYQKSSYRFGTWLKYFEIKNSPSREEMQEIEFCGEDDPRVQPTTCGCTTGSEYWGKCPKCGKWSGEDEV